MEQVEKYYTPENCGKSQSWCEIANVYAFLHRDTDINGDPLPWSESVHPILDRSEQDLNNEIINDVKWFGITNFASEFHQPEMTPIIKSTLESMDVADLTRRELQLGRSLELYTVTQKEHVLLKLEKMIRQSDEYNNWAYRWYHAFEALKDNYGLGCVCNEHNRYTFVCDTGTGRSGISRRKFDDEHDSRVGICTAFAILCGAEYPSEICKIADLSTGDTFHHIGELLRMRGLEHTYVVGDHTTLYDGSSARVCIDNKFPGVGSAFRDTDYVVKVE